MRQKKRILVCPLDWGLGHATRCIPIIRLLLQKNQDVLIAGSGRSFILLKQEFPTLEFIDLPGYDIRYSKNGLAIQMFFSIPRILKGIKREHELLKNIVQEKKIDIVISDNRFGLWSHQAKTIFITHQLSIKSPLGEYVLHRINLHYIKKYDQCWIPDSEGESNLSGELTHTYSFPENAFFIGLLSRFTNQLPSTTPATAFGLKKSYDVMVIISGPEPQRSIFEKLILKQVSTIPLRFLITRGITEQAPIVETKGNIDIVSHLSSTEMEAAILSASMIVSRSGYSTLMDLAALNKKAVFIPTPGQTEQEYLAERCMKNGVAYFEDQSNFNLKNALEKGVLYTGFKYAGGDNLEKRIDSIIVE
jgi:predicted glycosyltransferase